MSGIIDSHCHLDFDAFDTDRAAVIDAAVDSGVEQIIIPAVDTGNWDKIAALCDADARLHACYGLHPCYVDRHQPDHLDALIHQLSTHDCVALGECGLDYREGMADKALQQFYFSRQLEIAEQQHLPVVIHSVRATQDVITQLKRFSGLTGVVHSYSGSYQQAVQLHEMGFYLGFGGVVTYDRASRVRETVSKLPLDAMLLETDAPDQPDAEHHGERNEPVYINKVIDCIVALREEPRQGIIEQTAANARLLFDI